MEQISSVPMPVIGSRGAFVEFLKFAHGIMRASGPLLEMAAEKSAGALRDYYRAHWAEEHEHVAWLAEDLAALGVKPPVIDHAAAATAGAQYYYLQHVGPHALLGYIAALEFKPPLLDQVELLERLYGAAAVRTLRHHAVHDPEHAKELARLIDEQPDEVAPIICYSAFVTTKMLSHYLTDRMKGAQ